ncbi:MAG: InlB B-repeat-containing protein, partial [Clostridia bacterium]
MFKKLAKFGAVGITCFTLCLCAMLFAQTINVKSANLTETTSAQISQPSSFNNNENNNKTPNNLPLSYSANNASNIAIAEQLSEKWGASQYAEPTAEPTIKGYGTQESPFLIDSAEKLAKVATNVNAGTNASSYYKLTNNINLSGKIWTPIGSGNPFSGFFDGNGYSITGLTINSISYGFGNYAGLFGYVKNNDNYIKNMSLKQVLISSTSTTNVGGLVGSSFAGEGGTKTLTISQIAIESGIIQSNYFYNTYIGGIVGSGDLKTTIESCFVSAIVKNMGTEREPVYTSYAIAGGSATVKNCYGTADVFNKGKKITAYNNMGTDLIAKGAKNSFHTQGTSLSFTDPFKTDPWFYDSTTCKHPVLKGVGNNYIKATVNNAGTITFNEKALSKTEPFEQLKIIGTDYSYTAKGFVGNSTFSFNGETLYTTTSAITNAYNIKLKANGTQTTSESEITIINNRQGNLEFKFNSLSIGIYNSYNKDFQNFALKSTVNPSAEKLYNKADKTETTCAYKETKESKLYFGTSGTILITIPQVFELNQPFDITVTLYGEFSKQYNFLSSDEIAVVKGLTNGAPSNLESAFLASGEPKTCTYTYTYATAFSEIKIFVTDQRLVKVVYPENAVLKDGTTSPISITNIEGTSCGNYALARYNKTFNLSGRSLPFPSVNQAYSIRGLIFKGYVQSASIIAIGSNQSQYFNNLENIWVDVLKEFTLSAHFNYAGYNISVTATTKNVERTNVEPYFGLTHSSLESITSTDGKVRFEGIGYKNWFIINSTNSAYNLESVEIIANGTKTTIWVGDWGTNPVSGITDSNNLLIQADKKDVTQGIKFTILGLFSNFADYKLNFNLAEKADFNRTLNAKFVDNATSNDVGGLTFQISEDNKTWQNADPCPINVNAYTGLYIKIGANPDGYTSEIAGYDQRLEKVGTRVFYIKSIDNFFGNNVAGEQMLNFRINNSSTSYTVELEFYDLNDNKITTMLDDYGKNIDIISIIKSYVNRYETSNASGFGIKAGNDVDVVLSSYKHTIYSVSSTHKVEQTNTDVDNFERISTFRDVGKTSFSCKNLLGGIGDPANVKIIIKITLELRTYDVFLKRDITGTSNCKVRFDNGDNTYGRWVDSSNSYAEKTGLNFGNKFYIQVFSGTSKFVGFKINGKTITASQVAVVDYIENKTTYQTQVYTFDYDKNFADFGSEPIIWAYFNQDAITYKFKQQLENPEGHTYNGVQIGVGNFSMPNGYNVQVKINSTKPTSLADCSIPPRTSPKFTFLPSGANQNWEFAGFLPKGGTSTITGNTLTPTDNNITEYTLIFKCKKITVNLNQDNGAVASTKEIYYNFSCGTEMPVKNYYTFNGYKIDGKTDIVFDKDGKLDMDVSNQIFINNDGSGYINATAQWDPSIYTFKFEGETEEVTYAYGSNNTSGNAPIPANNNGYQFIGWGIANNTIFNGTGIFDKVAFDTFITTSQSTTITLSALWSANSVTITYDALSGIFENSPQTSTITIESATQTGLKEYKVPNFKIVREGYTFAGWKMGETKIMDLYNVPISGSGQTRSVVGLCFWNSNWGLTAKLDAIWNSVQFNIVYDVNGGEYGGTSKPANVQLIESAINFDSRNYQVPESKSGTVVDIQASTPTKTGHTFLGWADKSNTKFNAPNSTWAPIDFYINASAYNSATIIDGKLHVTGISFKKTDAMFLKAVWKANKYDLTFNANGGVFAGGSTTLLGKATYGSDVYTVPESPTRQLFVFMGWAKKSDATVADFIDANSTTGKEIWANQLTTVYAVWKNATYLVDVNKQITKNGEKVGLSELLLKVDFIANSTIITDTFNIVQWHTLSGVSKIGTTSCTTLLIGDFSQNLRDAIKLQNILPNEKIEVVINYEVFSYTLKFTGNNVSNNVKFYHTDLELFTPVDTKAGYSFLGWLVSGTTTPIIFAGGNVLSDKLVNYIINNNAIQNGSIIEFVPQFAENKFEFALLQNGVVKSNGAFANYPEYSTLKAGITVNFKPDGTYDGTDTNKFANVESGLAFLGWYYKTSGTKILDNIGNYSSTDFINFFNGAEKNSNGYVELIPVFEIVAPNFAVENISKVYDTTTTACHLKATNYNNKLNYKFVWKKGLETKKEEQPLSGISFYNFVNVVDSGLWSLTITVWFSSNAIVSEEKALTQNFTVAIASKQINISNNVYNKTYDKNNLLSVIVKGVGDQDIKLTGNYTSVNANATLIISSLKLEDNLEFFASNYSLKMDGVSGKILPKEITVSQSFTAKLNVNGGDIEIRFTQSSLDGEISVLLTVCEMPPKTYLTNEIKKSVTITSVGGSANIDLINNYVILFSNASTITLETLDGSALQNPLFASVGTFNKNNFTFSSANPTNSESIILLTPKTGLKFGTTNNFEFTINSYTKVDGVLAETTKPTNIFNAGKYFVTLKNVSFKGYSPINVSLEITINQMNIVVNGNIDKQYDGTNQVLQTTILGLNIIKADNSTSLPNTNYEIISSGTYARSSAEQLSCIVTLIATNNYKISGENNGFILKRDITIFGAEILLQKFYDGKAYVLNLNKSITINVNGNSSPISCTGSLEFTKIVDAGQYKLSEELNKNFYTINSGENSLKNFNIIFDTSCNVTIKRAVLWLESNKVATDANNQSFVYKNEPYAIQGIIGEGAILSKNEPSFIYYIFKSVDGVAQGQIPTDTKIFDYKYYSFKSNDGTGATELSPINIGKYYAEITISNTNFEFYGAESVVKSYFVITPKSLTVKLTDVPYIYDGNIVKLNLTNESLFIFGTQTNVGSYFSTGLCVNHVVSGTVQTNGADVGEYNNLTNNLTSVLTIKNGEINTTQNYSITVVGKIVISKSTENLTIVLKSTSAERVYNAQNQGLTKDDFTFSVAPISTIITYRSVKNGSTATPKDSGIYNFTITATFSNYDPVTFSGVYSILQKDLILSNSNTNWDKIYDGSSLVNGTINKTVESGNPAMESEISKIIITGNYSYASVGAGLKINFALSGEGSQNYSTPINISGNIYVKEVVISFTTAPVAIYGKTNLSYKYLTNITFDKNNMITGQEVTGESTIGINYSAVGTYNFSGISNFSVNENVSWNNWQVHDNKNNIVDETGKSLQLNYKFIFAQGSTLTINKAEINVKLSSVATNNVYDGKEKTITMSSEIVNGGGTPVWKNVVNTGGFVNVGTSTVIFELTAESAKNYVITSMVKNFGALNVTTDPVNTTGLSILKITCSMNITPKEIVVNFGSLTKSYNGTAFLHTVKSDDNSTFVSINGLVFGHTLSLNLSTDKSDVGMYVLTGYNALNHAGVINSVPTITGTTANNYTIVLNGTMEITKATSATISIRSADLASTAYSALNRTLNKNNLEMSPAFSQDLSSIEFIYYQKKSGGNYVEIGKETMTALNKIETSTGVLPKNVGEYKVQIFVNFKNYAQSACSGFFEIVTRQLNITLQNGESWNKVYDGTTTFNSKVDCTPQGENIVAVETELKSMQINGTYASAFVNTGIAITFILSGVGSQNYGMPTNITGNIVAKSLTLMLNSGFSKFYDANSDEWSFDISSFTKTGLLATETLSGSITFLVKNANIYSVLNSLIKKSGNQILGLSINNGASLENYLITINGNLEIKRAEINVEISCSTTNAEYSGIKKQIVITPAVKNGNLTANQLALTSKTSSNFVVAGTHTATFELADSANSKIISATVKTNCASFVAVTSSTESSVVVTLTISLKQVELDFGSLTKYYNGNMFSHTVKSDDNSTFVSIIGLVSGHTLSLNLTTDKSITGMYVLKGKTGTHVGLITEGSLLIEDVSKTNLSANYNVILSGTMEILQTSTEGLVFENWFVYYSAQNAILHLPSFSNTTGFTKRHCNLTQSCTNKLVSSFRGNSGFAFYLPSTTKVTITINEGAVSSIIDAGVYFIKVELQDDSYQYSSIGYTAILKVAARQLKITSRDWNKIYDGSSLVIGSINKTVKLNSGEISNAVMDNEINNLAITGKYKDESANYISHVGEYAIGFVLSRTSNYVIASAGERGSITAKQVTLTATNWSKYYDGADISIP